MATAAKSPVTSTDRYSNFQEALAACSPNRSLCDLAEAEGNVGFIKQCQSRFDEATEYYRKAMQHAQEGGDACPRSQDGQ